MLCLVPGDLGSGEPAHWTLLLSVLQNSAFHINFRQPLFPTHLKPLGPLVEGLDEVFRGDGARDPLTHDFDAATIHMSAHEGSLHLYEEKEFCRSEVWQVWWIGESSDAPLRQELLGGHREVAWSRGVALSTWRIHPFSTNWGLFLKILKEVSQNHDEVAWVDRLPLGCVLGVTEVLGIFWRLHNEAHDANLRQWFLFLF